MQYEFNDYKRLTRGYLCDYRTWQNALDAWAKEKVDIESELSSVPVAISKYGEEPGGGTGELNVVEREASKRIKLRERSIAIDKDTIELRRVMRNIDTAIHSLGDETREIVCMHYIDGKTWLEVAEAFNYSESAVKQRGYRAVGKISGILFGSKANAVEQVVLIA